MVLRQVQRAWTYQLIPSALAAKEACWVFIWGIKLLKHLNNEAPTGSKRGRERFWMIMLFSRSYSAQAPCALATGGRSSVRDMIYDRHDWEISRWLSLTSHRANKQALANLKDFFYIPVQWNSTCFLDKLEFAHPRKTIWTVVLTRTMACINRILQVANKNFVDKENSILSFTLQ